MAGLPFPRAVRRVLRWLALVVALWFFTCSFGLVCLRFINPVLTGVQAQRIVEAIFGDPPLRLRRDQVNLAEISPSLRNAVVASEDARFWTHHGIDFVELRNIAEDAVEDGEIGRGGSTITQQLVKNLFFTTHRNPLRKIAEFLLAPVAEFILPKDRILELYLNNVEWGEGVYGAEAAAQFHFGHGAQALNRNEAARLAAILPSPRRWRPARMDRRAAQIDQRMRQMGH
jgi:monofunctional glycosyltransferase